MGIDICQCLCTSCVCLTIPLWLPCYLLWYVSYRRHHPSSEKAFRARKKHRKATKPKPLSQKRRTLSISFDPKLNAQSPLLSLPAELRLQIYNYVLGGKRIHLLSMPKSVGHIQCYSSHKISRVCNCIPETKLNMSAAEKSLGGFGPSMNGILGTCRQVYTEAVEILYNTNTFSINNLWTLIDFSKAIPSQRLAGVTRLQIEWNLRKLPLNPALRPSRGGEVKYENNLWETFWDVVAHGMSGLVDVRIKLTVSAAADCNLELGWVKPLLQVHGLKRCNIRMHLREEDNSPQPAGVLFFMRKLEESMCAVG